MYVAITPLFSVKGFLILPCLISVVCIILNDHSVIRHFAQESFSSLFSPKFFVISKKPSLHNPGCFWRGFINSFKNSFSIICQFLVFMLLGNRRCNFVKGIRE